MENEMQIRLISFISILSVIAIWEVAAPRRKLTVNKGIRWLNNGSIILLNTLIVRLALPILPVLLAVKLSNHGSGLFNMLEIPLYLKVFFSIIIMDLILYLQHAMFHAMPLFWRLHMVHHADLDLDVTTALRFHPIEILLSTGLKLAIVMVLGPPAVAVMIFEIILNGAAMFHHGNIKLPSAFDRILRKLIITPDMHRIHHSVIIRETNSNFGFNIAWWDYIFGTYRAQPMNLHENMPIGLMQYRKTGDMNFFKLMALPFIGETGLYSMNKWGGEPKNKK